MSTDKPEETFNPIKVFESVWEELSEQHPEIYQSDNKPIMQDMFLRGLGVGFRNEYMHGIVRARVESI